MKQTTRLTQTAMVLQVDRAWEYLNQEEEANEPFVHYEMKVKSLNGGPEQRGIYLRENANTNSSSTFRVNVTSIKVTAHSLIIL